MFVIGKFYEFTLVNNNKYYGKCVREIELDKVDNIYKVGFVSHKENEKTKSDFTVNLNTIKSYKEIDLDTLLSSYEGGE